MKKFIYWLMGEKTGRVLVSSWNWLLGKPVNSGGLIAVEVAAQALNSIQESVVKLTESVANLIAAYELAKQKYEIKVKEYQNFEMQAQLADRQGNEEAARLAMSKAILIERIIPQLKQQVEQAEQVVKTARNKLNRERQRLETYKLELQNLKELSAVNEALAVIIKTNSDFNIDSPHNQFKDAQFAIERRNLQSASLSELIENPTEKLQADLESIALEDEVARRLSLLNEQREKEVN